MRDDKKILVIVESPTKVKTIKKYLDDDYDVIASNGHIRDLPESQKDLKKEDKEKFKDVLGIDIENNFEPLYVVPKGKSKIISELKKRLKNAKELILATDEDREGESIAYHLRELLVPKVKTYRVTFNEITQKAIKEAFEHKRDLDMDLVKAQETRRLVDRIYGYSLSPLLWKKIVYGLSAGRVQSPALKAIVKREEKRFLFKSANYYSIQAEFFAKNINSLSSELSYYKDQKVASNKDFDDSGELKKNCFVLDKSKADEIVLQIKDCSFSVFDIKKKDVVLSPPPPFITSSLQQEASKVLNLSPKETMKIAQSLYENGFITYMRTDSYNISDSVMPQLREHISDFFGQEYLEDSVVKYASKSNSQEAHEAIRPSFENNEFKGTDDVFIQNELERKLYDLIHKRTVASQMKKAKRQVFTVLIKSQNSEFVFQSSFSSMIFQGYLKAYGKEEEHPLKINFSISDKLQIKESNAIEHNTKPPQRFSESKLIEKLEKEGIGRPSTYASIISNLLEKEYVVKRNSNLIPTFKGFVVYQFLEENFSNLLDYAFTSDLEENLDKIAIAEYDKNQYLKDFYLSKNGLKNKITEKEKEITPVKSIKFPFLHQDYQLKIGKFGVYLEYNEQKADIPDDFLPADLQNGVDDILKMKYEKKPVVLLDDGSKVFYLMGKYGKYLQVVNPQNEVKNLSLPKKLEVTSLSEEKLKEIASLPKILGAHDNIDVKIATGAYGFYIQYDKIYVSINYIDVSFQKALELIKEKKEKLDKITLRDFGLLRKKELKIMLRKSGPCIKYGKKIIFVPKEYRDKIKEIDIETVKEIIKNSK